jgi:two-component system response regulator AtoC
MTTKAGLRLSEPEERLSFRLTVALPIVFALLAFLAAFGAMTLTRLLFRVPTPQNQLWIQIWMIGAPVVAGVLGVLLAYSITRPLRKVTLEAQTMLRNARIEPLPVQAVNELSALSVVLDQALVSFAELVQAREILDNLTEAVLAIDRDKNIAGMNRRAQELFETSFPDARGRPLSELLTLTTSNGVLVTLVEEVLKEDAERVYPRLKFSLPSGKDVLLSVKGSPLKHNGNGTIGVVLVLKERANQWSEHPEIIGQSEGLLAVMGLVARVAPTDAAALILGESGTGKELIAAAIHRLSRRKDHPLVKLNCAAIPEGLLESELFGHEKGAFTGAMRKKPGKFELADGGTIFLDEIGDMSPSLQAKLLRVLQDGEVTPVGGVEAKKVSVRIIAASNKELPREVEAGRFREDLYHRLNVFTIPLLPLRERQPDIPLLAEHFLSRAAERLGIPEKSLSREALDCLLEYSWPGNVRELRNVLERAALLADGPVIQASDLPPNGLPPRHEGHEGEGTERWPMRSATLKETLQTVERGLILRALGRAAGVQVEAAKLLGVEPKNLWHKIRKHQIDLREQKANGAPLSSSERSKGKISSP